MTRDLNTLSDTDLLKAIFCALQDGDWYGHLPGAILQVARVRTLSPEDADWLDNLHRGWCSQNAYQRWAS